MSLLLVVDVIGPEIFVVCTHSNTSWIQGDCVPRTTWWSKMENYWLIIQYFQNLLFASYQLESDALLYIVL